MGQSSNAFKVNLFIDFIGLHFKGSVHCKNQYASTDSVGVLERFCPPVLCYAIHMLIKSDDLYIFGFESSYKKPGFVDSGNPLAQPPPVMKILTASLGNCFRSK